MQHFSLNRYNFYIPYFRSTQFCMRNAIRNSVNCCVGIYPLSIDLYLLIHLFNCHADSTQALSIHIRTARIPLPHFPGLQLIDTHCFCFERLLYKGCNIIAQSIKNRQIISEYAAFVISRSRGL